ncbi:MAG: 5-bromo-4-chloroindolyl phosphate hydrolysis family protein [Clostridia bacterium]|nr:5-bromo-4-chloroindolyl phosphate hydrolysis family protein [Clostridia bacterium]
MKKLRIKSAAPIYCAAAVWVLIGLVRPSMFLSIVPLIVTALISAGVYFGASKLFPGKVVEVEEKVDTGNADVDRQIVEGRERLNKLQQYNDVLPDPVISQQLDRMKKAGDSILAELEKNPSHYTEVRRFMNYFLPTTEKLVSSYVQLNNMPTRGENVKSAMTTVENSLGKIADAFEKQLDSLFRDQSFDMEADASVLETMLKGDGLIDRQTLYGASQSDQSTPQAGV